ncbi:MAG: AIDA repeat-containing protein, partial [Elusimicrobiales bacterium]|nr:AIDA repeat-containing protein [Elusimicrobiales bacterium]
ASGFNVDSGGYLNIHSGGSAVNISNHGGNINVDVIGGDNDTYVSGYDYRYQLNSFGLSGGIASNFILGKGGWQNVLDGGVASNTMLFSGAVQNVSSGGIAQNTTIGYTSVYDYGYGVYSFVSVGGVQNISEGGIASNTVINVQGSQVVSSGGLAVSTTVNSGGSQIVESAGTVRYTTVSSGGWQYVSYGGIVEDNTVLSGGSQVISFGGNTSGMIISGVQYVSAGATDVSATILSGGQQHILSDGTASNATVNNSGSQIVSNGGNANYTTVNSGGIQSVENGGSASNTVINENGQQIISAGGLSVSATINSGGSQHIKSAGVASDTTINVGGWQYVSNGGSAVNNIVGSGGSLVVYNGGVVSNTVVQYGGSQIISSGETSNAIISGTQYVSAGGIDTSATIVSGGQQHILSDGIANNATVNAHGSQIVSAGGTANSTTVNNQGIQIVSNGGIVSNAVVNIGGTQNVLAEGTANRTTVYGGTQNLSGGRANAASLINGTQNIFADGEAYQTTLTSGGIQNIYDGGMAEDVSVNSGTAQNVHSGGSSYSATINQGGTLNIASGGYASDVVQNSGGNINADVYGGDTATYISGTNQNGGGMRMFGGTASGFVLNSGGRQSVNNGGTASGTVVYAGAEQWVNSGNAAGTVLSGGTMWLASAGEAGSLTINSGGTAYITGTHTMSGDNAINAGGKITLTRINKTTPAVLTMQNLSGNGGTVSMNVSLSKPEASDKIIITGTHSAGNTVLSLKNIGSSKEIQDDSLKLVEYSGGAAADGTFSLKGGKWDTGWYEYTLGRGDSDGNGNDYYLRSTNEMTPVAKTATTAPAMGNVAINVALNSLQKRLGDLRNMGNGNAQHGTWARGYYQSLTLKDKVETEMKVSGIEAGYDFRLSGTGSSGGEGTYLGIMAGKASIGGINGKSKTGNQESKGEGEGILGGAYLTYIGESGFFADFTARAGTNKLDLSAYSASEDDWLKFSPERTFMAASMEAGMSFVSGGLKIEPKAEMQYMNIGGKDVEIDGLDEKIKFGGASYLTAIGTLNAAYSWKRSNGLITQPYAEVSYSQELSGEEEITYVENKDKSSMKGGFIEGRIGLNMQLTDSLYWHAAASFESGSKREGFGADAGIRYMFGGSSRDREKAEEETLPKKENIAAASEATEPAENIAPVEPAAEVITETAQPIAEVPALPKAQAAAGISELNSDVYVQKANAAKPYEGELIIPSAGILFKTNSSEVLAYYFPMLNAFINLYKQTDGSTTVLVEGYS